MQKKVSRESYRQVLGKLIDLDEFSKVFAKRQKEAQTMGIITPQILKFYVLLKHAILRKTHKYFWGGQPTFFITTVPEWLENTKIIYHWAV